MKHLLSKVFLMIIAISFLPTVGGMREAYIYAQKVTISPVPQSIKWSTKAFDNTATFKITDVGADTDAIATLQAVLGSRLSDAGEVEIVIGELDDEGMSSYKAYVPTKAEGYYLKVESNKIVIVGKDGNGTFYGVQTLRQILQSPEVMSVTVKDYPSVSQRGVIEGFYGNPWSTTDRKRQFDFYGENKMNTYVYGPKDDPYHRANWRDAYPTAQGKVIKELVEYAKKNKVNFVWAVHPGGDIKWNLTDSMNVVKKFENMYKLGVRHFSIFFDDISGEGAQADKQAGLLNYVTDNFVKKYDDVAPLSICPTQYNRAWSGGTYLSTLGNDMYSEVQIMWTGNSVVDMINKSDMTWINNQIQRKAFIWLNYPVNDYCIGHMLMGKTYGNDSDIADMVSAFCSNPMEYAEASKVSLYSIADYSWNMTDYQPEASWFRAMEYLMPTATEAFRVFCEHNVDLGSTYHGLRRENESQAFDVARQVFETAIAKGYDTDAIAKMQPYIDSLVWAADELQKDSVNHPEMIAEITPWMNVLRYIGQRGQIVLSMYSDIYENRPTVFIEKYKQIQEIQAKEDAVRSRNFEGSIKTPHPEVAKEVVNPFIKRQITDLVQLYKQRYNEGWENFPISVLNNGNYFIKYNGKYLTDVNASPTRTGDYPVFQAARDGVNPQRQEWTISIDATTDRYKIVNTQDSRYINEKGEFWASSTSNPYEPEWHTYNLIRMNGKYAIQNAGSAGSNFWSVSGTRIQKGSNNGDVKMSDFIFEIVPVEGDAPAYPVIEEGTAYFIERNDGLTLTDEKRDGTGTPVFKALGRADILRKYQQFYFAPNENTGRWKIVPECNKTAGYLNENGGISKAGFNETEHTYVISEIEGMFAIRTAGDDAKYWQISDNSISQGNAAAADSYIFKILTKEQAVGINDVETATTSKNNDFTYNIAGQKVNNDYRGIIIQNNKKILQK